MTLYQATTSYFCAGLIVHNGIIVEAAPIIKWSERKTLRVIELFLAKKGGKLEMVKTKC